MENKLYASTNARRDLFSCVTAYDEKKSELAQMYNSDPVDEKKIQDCKHDLEVLREKKETLARLVRKQDRLYYLEHPDNFNFSEE